MLFVLVMEVLNHLVCWLDTQGFLTPLGIAALPFRVSLYADDVVLFVAPRIDDLLVIKGGGGFVRLGFWSVVQHG